MTTQAGVAYLTGLLTPIEADRMIQIARNVPGVVRVVKAFEFTICHHSERNLNGAARVVLT